ncbi:MAG: acyl-CoA dehydrogenase family protein [Candidatus Melainabacteria bacterium]|nr:acyl-CoA dehydrogenase family protein [Candidatus Melainabacteria bacterium]
MSLIVDVDPAFNFYVPGQLYLPDYLGGKGKSATTKNQDATVKQLMKKSGGMLGTGQNGIISDMTAGGVLRLNSLEEAADNKLSPEKQKEINAYSQLINDAMRLKSDIVLNWLDGYGSTPDDIAPDLKKEYEYNLARWTISNNASLARLQNPSTEVKEWMNNLNLKFKDLKEALVNPFQIDEEIYVRPELLERMRDLGLFRLKIPEKFGGLGFNQREYDKVIRTVIHTYSGTLSGKISAHSTLGSKPFEYYGDFQQRHHHLPKIARGDGLVSFALTERGSGTDAINNAETIAKLSPDGKKYILNGSKIYITNTHRSSLMLIFAKVDDGGPELKPTVFIKELPFRLSDTQEQIDEKRQKLKEEGFYISKPLKLSGIRGSNQAYIEFHNLEIPIVNEEGITNILGEVGEGTKVIFNSLNAGRAGFGSFCAEAARCAFQMSVLEAIQRRRFDEHGGRLADLPQVKRYIAEMAIKTEALDAAVELTTNLVDTFPHMNIIAECAAIKVLSSEEAWKISTTAARMFGGQSLMKGHPIELIRRDMWVPLIVEGVTEALKQHLVGVGAKPALKAGMNPIALGKLGASRLKYESGGLSINDMWWIQRKTKSYSARAMALGLLNGNKTMLKQKELLALADEAIEIYQAAAVLLKLRDQSLPEHKKLALKQFIKNLKRKDVMIEGIRNDEHYPKAATSQIITKISPIKLKKKDLYPEEIANAYIKEAENELSSQRSLEEKIFKGSENNSSDRFKQFVIVSSQGEEKIA